MENGGYEGPVTVELLLTDLDFQRVVVWLTSGEARTMARHLEHPADVIDLAS